MLVLRLAPLVFFGFLGVPPKNAQKTNPLFFSLFIKCFNFAESCESYGYCRKKAADVFFWLLGFILTPKTPKTKTAVPATLTGERTQFSKPSVLYFIYQI